MIMQALASTPLPMGADTGIQVRMASLLLLVVHMMGAPFDQIPMYLNHFAIAKLPPAQDGTVYVTLTYSIEGTVSLPTVQQLQEVKDAAAVAFSTQQWGAMKALIDNAFTMEDGAPMHSGARGYLVERILTTVLATTGATKSARLAKGGAARDVAGKGKGRKSK